MAPANVTQVVDELARATGGESADADEGEQLRVEPEQEQTEDFREQPAQEPAEVNPRVHTIAGARDYLSHLSVEELGEVLQQPLDPMDYTVAGACDYLSHLSPFEVQQVIAAVQPPREILMLRRPDGGMHLRFPDGTTLETGGPVRELDVAPPAAADPPAGATVTREWIRDKLPPASFVGLVEDRQSGHLCPRLYVPSGYETALETPSQRMYSYCTKTGVVLGREPL